MPCEIPHYSMVHDINISQLDLKHAAQPMDKVDVGITSTLTIFNNMSTVNRHTDKHHHFLIMLMGGARICHLL